MSIIESIKRLFGSDATVPEIVVRDMMSGLYKINISACLTASSKWKPTLTMTTFESECSRRLEYLRGSMQSDMIDVLKRRFPKTYGDIIGEQVNIGLYKKIIDDKAKTFAGSKYILSPVNGGDVDAASMAAFEEMIERGNFSSVFRDADRQIHAIHRVALVLKYDRSRNCVRPIVWPQHMVHWVPDPDMYYSADASLCVMLQVPSDGGLADMSSRRYEVWARIAGDDGVMRGLHYYTGISRDGAAYDRAIDGNDDRVNPYIDPRTGEPMYPIVWWQADNEPSLYWMPDEDALTIQRMINAALTDINWGMHYGQHPIISWETQPGAENAVPPALSEIGPGRALTVAGLHPRFTSPGYDPEPAIRLWSTLAELEARIGGGVPISIMRESGSPESGYALRIRNLPLEEHRAEMIAIMRHHVDETLYRAAIVWNQYRDDKIDIDKYVPRWVPGSPSPPEDAKTSADIHAALVAAGVESPVEWRMSLYGETEQQATEAIERIRASQGVSTRIDLPRVTFGDEE